MSAGADRLDIVERERTGDTVRIALVGAIAADGVLAPLLKVEAAKLILDLGGVTRVNSIGVREWMLFVGALEQAGKQLVLERCSVPIVRQLNAIARFRGRGVVASVFAPYYCSACGRDHRELVELTPGMPVPDLTQAIACPKCKSPMELDDLAESYLGFQGS